MIYNVNNMTSFSAALSSNEENKDIILTDSFYVDKRIVISIGKNVNIHSDSSGPHTIYRGKNITSELFSIESNSIVITISNVIFDCSAESSGPLFTNTTGGTLKLRQGTVIKNSNSTHGIAGAIYNTGGYYVSTLDTDGAVFLNNYGESGGAIYNTGLLKLKNTIIKDCSSKIKGGAIYHNGKTMGGDTELDIDSCEISNNKSLNGGAIALSNTFCLIHGKTLLSDNKAENNGGAISVEYDRLANLNVEGAVVFKNNSAKTGYIINPEDIPLHDKHILTKGFTSPFKYGYNNYDISYTNGTPVSDDNKGNVNFPCIEFTETGEYHYTIRETGVYGDEWTTDKNEYPVIINIEKDENGNLVSDVQYPNGVPNFENIYSPKPICVTICATKTTIGAPLKEGQFTFGVFNKDGNEIASAKNSAPMKK